MGKEKFHFHLIMLLELLCYFNFVEKKEVGIGHPTNNIQDIYLKQATDIGTFEKKFCRFQNGAFNLNNKIRFVQT